jgi:hypothetical protein
MKVEELAALVLDACEAAKVEHMLTGAFAHGYYGIPRSTIDVDVVLSLTGPDCIEAVVRSLQGVVVFDPQWQFDTLTWGKRLVGEAVDRPGLKVELFELFGDPFVQSQFGRKLQLFSAQVGRMTWLPAPEDVVVQKIRWGRSKDLDDARDVLAVQGPETLDMAYVEKWCTQHGNMDRLQKLLAEVAGI